MKGYFRTVAIVFIIYFLAFAVFAAVNLKGSGGMTVSDETVVVMNDIAHDASENWNSIENLRQENYGVPFVILDSNNGIVLDCREGSSGSRDTVTIEKAVKNRYPYIYVTDGGRIVGTVILIDDGAGIVRGQKTVLTAAFGICGLAFLAGALIYGYYIKKNITEPFKKMEQFAGRVAEGRLDEPLLMDRNNMFGSFSESFDIMREELAASRKREIALQAKEKELVASLSHDLKTPITGIKLTTELMKAKLAKENDHGDMVSKIDNIYMKADEIDVLVTDLFTSTLDDLGEFKVNCTEEKSSVLNDIVRKHDDKELAAVSELPQVIIRVDVRRMSQVIGNIINNSYKYADTRIDISYRLTDGFLEMKIADHGPGVPSDEIELITNKFFRGRAQTEGGFEGSGLGLYIAKMLMEKMEGGLIASSEGRGLIVTLLIPLA